jgi:4-diphosphocytidyl-2-C-methyl-D-erythritol kinase
VFPGLGDRVWAEDGPNLSLSVGGPFGDMLGAGDNLVLRAAEALARAHGRVPRAALRLDKALPVASGIGGGSADAAAALRLLARLWRVTVPEDVALSLGADVPVCLGSKPALMAGIGERLTPGPALPPMWIVLVNPLATVSTASVFARVERREMPPGPAAPEAGFAAFGPLVEWLSVQRNDLEPAAMAVCPPIARVLEALKEAPLARMSGSGATCFALLPDRESAIAVAERLRRAEPRWWIAAAPVG